MVLKMKKNKSIDLKATSEKSNNKQDNGVYQLTQEEWEAQYENVPQDVKDLWEVELDLLQKFDEVCKKHNFKWFADGGTLLGTVRHQGFIPWDDDIDIVMPFDDYNRLCELQKEFTWPYFLQTWETEEGFMPFMIKIRRSDTTGYSYREESTKGWNKGIAIDVFALVNIPDNKVKEVTQLLLLKGLRALFHGYESLRDNRQTANSRILNEILKRMYQLFSPVLSYKKISSLYMKIASWEKKKTKKCGPMLFVPGQKAFIWPSEWYEKPQMKKFMKMEMPCPEEWDARLTQQYGNYRIPQKDTSKHGKIIFDPYHSYLDKKEDRLE